MQRTWEERLQFCSFHNIELTLLVLNLVHLPIGALISLFQRLLCLWSILLAIVVEKERDKDRVAHGQSAAWRHSNTCVQNTIPRPVDLIHRSLPKTATKEKVINKETRQCIDTATQVVASCK